MRVFHFVNEEFGLEDLRKRRLKIATLHELNDPFELFGVSLADESLRRAFRAMKDQLASNRGLLCFSRDWHNPVQWSHYAAKHTDLPASGNPQRTCRNSISAIESARVVHGKLR